MEVDREAERAMAEQVAEAAKKEAADIEADNTLAASLQLAGLPQGMQELFKQIDVDSSGSVEWDEFLAFALPLGADYGHIKQLWQQLSGWQATAVAAELEVMKGSLQVVLQLQHMCTHSRCHLPWYPTTTP